jgi:hypothetical protein
MKSSAFLWRPEFWGGTFVIKLENGGGCQMKTLKKIVRALGYEPESRPFFKAKGDS